ncbi:MAG: teichoic acid biosynthesis protein C, partial [Actinomadura sp.]
QPSHDLFRHQPLFHQTVMQSFTFDNVNRRLFVAQLRNGGSSDANGDLCITQLEFDGSRRGHMHLNGFGHGVSIGVEPAGSASVLWTEAGPVTHVGETNSARGTQLGRVLFTDGLELHWNDPRVQKHKPIPDADMITCATDPINNRLVMRHHRKGDPGDEFRFAAYRITDLNDRRYDRKLADIAQTRPQRPPAPSPTFQGFAVYGQYVYMLDGDSYDKVPEPGNAFVSSIDLNGSGSFDRVPTNAGGSLDHREPEGMAVYRTVDDETRLFLGFASGEPDDRRANIFYKNVLVQ